MNYDNYMNYKKSNKNKHYLEDTFLFFALLIMHEIKQFNIEILSF